MSKMTEDKNKVLNVVDLFDRRNGEAGEKGGEKRRKGDRRKGDGRKGDRFI
jgi:hypothetical protein